MQINVYHVENEKIVSAWYYIGETVPAVGEPFLIEDLPRDTAIQYKVVKREWKLKLKGAGQKERIISTDLFIEAV